MKSRGYTLLELLMVIAMVAVVSTLALPMVGNLINRDAVVAADDSFSKSLQLARNSAAHRRINVAVYATGGDWMKGWCVRIVDGTTDCDASDNVLARFEALSPSVTVTANDTQIVYNSGGSRFGAGGAPATVVWEVSDATRRREVTVLPSGAFASRE